MGEIVAVDATGWHSPSALEHCCWDPDACARAGRVIPRLTSSPPAAVLEARWAEAEGEEPSDQKLAEIGRTRRGIETVPRVGGGIRQYRLFHSRGHWYRALDLTSGFRRYDGGAAWLGGYIQAGIDYYTGLALAVEVFPADVQEWDHYPALFDAMTEAVGVPPLIVSADRGYAIRPFYEFNTRRGVATVTPLRATRNRQTRLDWRTDMWDEDGVPRCQHCGGEGDQDSPGLGLVFGASEPSIRFRCVAPYLPECDSTQSIRCEEEWRMLVPLSRTTELYHAVRYAHSTNERFFRHMRERYGVGGKTFADQLRRPGVPPQRVRMWGAVLLDWFRAGLRNGWIESRGLPIELASEGPKRLSGLQDPRTGEVLEAGVGFERLGEVLRDREDAGTQLPYGAVAATAEHRVELALSG